MKPININKYFSIESFLEKQLLSGTLILVGIITAFIFANTSLAGIYKDFLNIKFALSIGSFSISKTLQLWMNDGMMTLFFLVIGFEIKREIIAGELSKTKNAVFPSIAALGGMILPICIFIFLNQGRETVKGWGIPMSTDIAFTLGIMLLLGKRVSKSLKVSITALAIIDDIGALIVIALFYSKALSLFYFLIIILVIAAITILNKLKIQSGIIYVASGLALWLLFMKSGIHPTISGVILAFLIPSDTKINFNIFKERMLQQINRLNPEFKNEEMHFNAVDEESKSTFKEIDSILKKVEPPLQRYERALKRYVNLLIVPLFAFINSGISLQSIHIQDLLSPLALGIIIGLMIGKSTGIFLFSFLSVKSGMASMPEKTNWTKVYGAGWLAGIGFTMSVFIAELSFHNENLLAIAKASILLGSVVSAVIGFAIVFFSEKSNRNMKASVDSGGQI